MTTSDTIISEIQRLQNKFIWLALRLPKYISVKLLHDSYRLPYVKDRLLSCATRTSDRSSKNPLLFLIYVNDLPKPHHRQNSKSQLADDTALWAASKNVQFAAKRLRKNLRKLGMWCAKWRIKLNPEKLRSSWRESQSLSSSEISRYHFRL